jgi:signal transduction histidine kinase
VTAHELRTPVGVLGGSAETLAEHWSELTTDERNELLEGMAKSTRRLRRLLADLLTASRLQTSRLEMNPEPVLVGAVVEDAVATIRRTWPEAEILYEPSGKHTVVGDRDRLAQAVDNLLSNALRHGSSPVRVRVVGGSGVAEIRVEDHGAGVPPEMQPRLFDRFATGRRRGGTGLGLFIVRELARAHGGDAFYEPAAPGSPAGAFVITLPTAEDPDALSS